MPTISQSSDKPVIIRIGQGTIAFLTPNADGAYDYHPYAVKSGMSIAANLRKAFKEEPYLADSSRKATLLVSSPILLVPEDEYNGVENFDLEAAYSSVITGHRGDMKVAKEMEELNVVAIYPVNSDLHMVVSDHFTVVDTQNVMPMVWQHTYNKYYQSGSKRRLFTYFHDKAVDIFCFEQHRIRFANSFQVTHAHDALYYTLFTWKQLGMNVSEDELHVLGNMPHEDWLMERYKAYVKNVNINGNARKDDLKALSEVAPAGNSKGLGSIKWVSEANDNHIPFDLMLCEEREHDEPCE